MKATSPFLVVAGLLCAGDAAGVSVVVRPHGSANACATRGPGELSFIVQVVLDSEEAGTAVLGISNLNIDGTQPFLTGLIANPAATWDENLALSFSSCVPSETIVVTGTVFGYDGRPLRILASGPLGIGSPVVRLCNGTSVIASTPALCINNPSCCNTDANDSTWGGVKRLFE